MIYWGNPTHIRKGAMCSMDNEGIVPASCVQEVFCKRKIQHTLGTKSKKRIGEWILCSKSHKERGDWRNKKGIDLILKTA